MEKSIGTQWVEWQAKKTVEELITQFDNAAGDKTKLEIAGRIISIVQKVMFCE